MESQMKVIEARGEDVCDTSVPSDDEISVCSWTTDQGDFADFDRFFEVSAETQGAQMNDLTVPPNSVEACASKEFAMVLPNTCQSVDYLPTFVPVFVPLCYVAPPETLAAEANGIATPYYSQPAEYFQAAPIENSDAYLAQHAQFEQRNPYLHKQWTQARGTDTTKHSQSTPSKRQAPRQDSKQAKVSVGGDAATEPEADPTTVILRNLPLECTRDMLLQLLDENGFAGQYDFVHLPIDFQTTQCLGYGIVNLIDHDAALRIHKYFNGFATWGNECEVAWNSPLQGLAANIDRYRNSPLMHPSVLETRRPVLFGSGVQIPFPEPTSRVRAPRIRHQKNDSAVDSCSVAGSE